MFRTVFQILPFLFAGLLAVVFARTARLTPRVRFVWTAVFLVCAAKFVGFGLFGGDVFNPELPEKLVWVWNWAYSGMCLMLALALPWALACRCARAAPRADAWRAGGRVVLPVLAWALAARGLYNGIKVPDLVEVPVVCTRLPAALEGYRIVHLTDIHVSAAATRARTEALVARANAADADLVVCTGDIVDGLPCNQARNVEPLCDLRAKDGVLFCTGNHEYYSDWRGWRAQYDRWGLRFLHNEWVSPRPGLVVAGVDDPASIFNPSGESFGPFPSLNQALAGAPEGAFRLLLQHRPHVNFEVFGEVPEARFDLQLSGHTHGGVAPGLRALVKAFNSGCVRGLYTRADGSRLYVSPGAGQWAGFPVRFFNDPEITVFTLHRKP